MIDSSQRDHVLSTRDRNHPFHTVSKPPNNIPLLATSMTPFYPCTMCYTSHSDTILQPCLHVFHFVCLDSVRMKENLCPVCLTEIQCVRDLVIRERYPIYNASQETCTPTQQIDTSHPKVVSPTLKCIRKGKWTAEESAYCDRLIGEFKKGNLPLAEGTTLRAFLSKLLHCDPMRISKKYTGDQCIGKIVFRRREISLPEEEMQKIRSELAELEKTYLEREETNHRRREKRHELDLNRDRYRCIMRQAFPNVSNESKARNGIPDHNLKAGHARSVVGSLQDTSHNSPLISKRSFQEITNMTQDERPSSSNIGDRMAIDKGEMICKVEVNGNCASHTEEDCAIPPVLSRNASVESLSSRVSSSEFLNHIPTNIKITSMAMAPSHSSVTTQNQSCKALSPTKTCSREGCIPRTHSLEQLSYLLEEHIPQSPSSKKRNKIGFSRAKGSNIDEKSHWEDNSKSQSHCPKPLRNFSGIFPRIPSLDEIHGISSTETSMWNSATFNGVNRAPSLERLASLEKLCRVSSSDFLARIGSCDQLPPSNSIPNCGSFGSLSSLAAGNFMPRNSSIEDILSLIASSESVPMQVASSTTIARDARPSILGFISESEVSKQRNDYEYAKLKDVRTDANNEITAATLLSLDKQRNFDQDDLVEKLNVAF